MRPVLVIGGGLAGAGVAIRLAEAGRAVTLVEKEAGPHDKVCGEFLSYEACDSLRRLGVDPVALGAVAIERVAVCVGNRRTATPLPFTALSLSRRVLDEAMLDRAAAAGASVRRGLRVTGLEREADGWRARTEGGETLAAAEVVLATGKHDLRGWKRPPGRQGDLIGFKLHVTLAEPLGPIVELHLFPGGYAGLEPVEGGRANLCLVVRKSAFDGWDNLWARLPPQLARTLAGAIPETPRPLAIAAIPYGHVRGRSDGLWRLGDQAAVIPSFAGEGMSIALHSAERAADVMLAGGTAHVFQRRLARDVGRQVAGATAVSQLLVRPWAQGAISAALAVAPGLARRVAKGTRLPGRALNDLPPLGEVPREAGGWGLQGATRAD